jgi:mitotic spindle assembly checkpoint protein MAD2B
VFTTVSFPIVPPKNHFLPFVLASSERNIPLLAHIDPKRLPKNHIPISDLHPQYTAVLARLATQTSSLKSLPENSSFTLAIELRQGATYEPPIGWPMPWLPSSPELQSSNSSGEIESLVWITANSEEGSKGSGNDSQNLSQSSSSGLWSSQEEEKSKESDLVPQDESKDPQKGRFLGGTRMIPVRNVEAGPFMMEVWVEEGEKESQLPINEDPDNDYHQPSVEDVDETDFF